jgi:protein TonB
MKILILFTAILVASNTAISQTKQNIQIPATEAEFPGGVEAMTKFLQENLEVPKNFKEGKNYIEFIIEKDGIAGSQKIMRGLDEETDKASLNLISKMPIWIPAKDVDGNPVQSKVILPISYRL